MATTYRAYLAKLGGTDPATYVGREGEIFWDPDVGALKLSDGSTPGGNAIGSGGGVTYTDSDAIDAVTGSDLDMGGNKVLFGNVYQQLSDLPNATNYHGMFAHVHATGKAYFAHAGNWVELLSGSVNGLQSRTTASVNTVNLSAGATDPGKEITGFKGYALYSVTANYPCRVRIYNSSASRTADLNRTQGVDPSPDAGVIAEAIFTAAGTLTFAPAVMGYNSDSTVSTDIPITVTNNDSTNRTITVSVNILQTEA